MADELIVRVITASAYGLLLALVLPFLWKEFKHFKEQFLEFQRRLQGRGLTMFDTWKKRYYMPELTDVSFKEQVRRVTLASLFLTAMLGLIAVGLGFAFDLPPDRAMLVPPIGGLVFFAFGVQLVLCFSLIRHVGKRSWKPLERIEKEPSAPTFETFPTKQWLAFGFAAAIAGFFGAASISYLFRGEVDWGCSAAIALGGFLGSVLMKCLMKRKGEQKLQFLCPECSHKFSVSNWRLLFTRHFRGYATPHPNLPFPKPNTTPIPQVAYYLKCPKCCKKSWLTPNRRTDESSQ